MPETKTKGKNATLEEEVQATLKRLEAKDQGLKQFLKKAYGYAVFPSVGKAALVVGGAYGKGLVFERGKMVGYATMSQLTLGVQLGGDTFSEVLAFESKESLDRFKKGRTAFAANASAVLVKAAAGGTADFEKGVAALAYTRGGMMLEMAIGGQKFKFKPAGEGEGEEDEQGGGKQQGRGKGKSARSQGEESEEEGEQDEESEEGDEDQQSGLLGRALGGVREAASKTTDFVKQHPVIATVVGTGLVASAVVYVVRSIRAASEGQEESEGEDEGQEEGDEEAQAEDQAESQDEGEEQEQDDQDDAEDSQNGHDSPRMMRRGKSRV
jgi:hypothetical protein